MSNNCIAIITARGGSKRIPRKNIKDFCGKPIMAYSIEAALGAGIFDEVMVSTEDEEIADIARKYGAKVPFMRSVEASNDYADTTEVLKEVINEYKKRGREFDYFCCIYPTAPFITGEKIRRCFELLEPEDVYNAVPMVPFSFPPQRGMIRDGKYVKPLFLLDIEKRSQDLEEVLHDCGQFYWCKTGEFLRNADILSNHTVPFIVSETEVQDIDNQTDWELAEMKYNFMRRKINEYV